MRAAWFVGSFPRYSRDGLKRKEMRFPHARQLKEKLQVGRRQTCPERRASTRTESSVRFQIRERAGDPVPGRFQAPAPVLATRRPAMPRHRAECPSQSPNRKRAPAGKRGIGRKDLRVWWQAGNVSEDPSRRYLATAANSFRARQSGRRIDLPGEAQWTVSQLALPEEACLTELGDKVAQERESVVGANLLQFGDLDGSQRRLLKL